jgi:hypothetical protein
VGAPLTEPLPTRTIVPDRSRLQGRCQDGVACSEVLDRLHGADVAVAAGIDPHHPALDRLRRKAEQIAHVHLAEDAARREGSREPASP